jgi:hypothetical protein
LRADGGTRQNANREVIVRAQLQIQGMRIAIALVWIAGPSPAARLPQSAGRAFDAYIAEVEARLAKKSNSPVSSFLVAARQGDSLVMEPVNGGSWAAGGGRLHHWRGATLAPGATAKDMLALLMDYNRLARYYAPDVVASRALQSDGERALVAMRFTKQRVVTVVLDAEFEQRSALTESRRGYSSSRSTHIWQVDHPGTNEERRRAEGDDDGFLWRLNSYWNFEETSRGLQIECEAVSLTRDVPAGLGWLVVPIIQSLSRDSLEFTLSATKNALLNWRSGHGREN